MVLDEATLVLPLGGVIDLAAERARRADFVATKEKLAAALERVKAAYGLSRDRAAASSSTFNR